MKLTVAELEELYFEDEIEVDGKTLTLVEHSEWEQGHKYQTKELIFTDGERFYRGHISRSGSPFTDWTYDSEIYGRNEPADVDEVEQREVTVTRWVVV